MFLLRFNKSLIKYPMIIILMECIIQVQAVERWVNEDHFKSGRNLLEFADDTSDIMVFFIVFVAGVLIIIPLIRYMCQNGYCGDGTNFDPDINAVVHPPPRQLVQQPQLHVAYANSGFVHSQVVLATAPPPTNAVALNDKPPDYSTVVMGDLSQGDQQTPYPRVATRVETRPGY